MKVTFIRPAMVMGRAADALEPLVFALLSGLTEPEVERTMYDDRIEDVPLDEPTDLVAMTVETATAKRAYSIAAEYHARGVPVVMGGSHPTLAPQETLRYATSIVVGDAEGVWGEVLGDAARGSLRPVYSNRAPTMAGCRYDRSIFEGKAYKSIALVQFGRGCNNVCDFCSVRAFYGSSVRHRPVNEVIDELAGLGRRHVFFVDDNLFVDLEAARRLLSAMVGLRLRWTCQAPLSTAADPQLLDLMYEAGCRLVIVGLESLEPRNLEQMRKSTNRSLGDYAPLVRAYNDRGMMVYGTFVFGYDYDTNDSFRRALDFALESKLCLANFNPLCPTPSTPLYARMRREGRLINDPWWLHPDYRYGQCLFRPRGMTPEQLEAGCYEARSLFNTYGSIFRRSFTGPDAFLRPRRALFSAALNLVARGEIHRKQGLPLGDGGLPEPLYEAGRA